MSTQRSRSTRSTAIVAGGLLCTAVLGSAIARTGVGGHHSPGRHHCRGRHRDRRRRGWRPVMVRPRRDQPRLHRRIRRQQLASRHHGGGTRRGIEVSQRRRRPVRRRSGRHAEGDQRHPVDGRLGRQRDRRLPRRRRGDPPGAAQRLRAGRRHRPLPGDSRRHGGRRLRHVHRQRLRRGGRDLGRVDPREPPRRRQRADDQRARRQQPGRGRGRRPRIGARADRLVHDDRRAAVLADQLGPGRDPTGPHRTDRRVPARSTSSCPTSDRRSSVRCRSSRTVDGRSH